MRPKAVPAEAPADGARHTDADNSPKASLVRRALIYTPSTIVPAGLLLLTSVIFTRIFPPAAFGAYSLVLVLATTVRLLFTEWLKQSIGKFLPPAISPEEGHNVRDAIFLATSVTFFVESLLGVIAFAVVRTLAPSHYRPFLVPVIVFLLATTVFEVLLTSFAAAAASTDYVVYKLVDSAVTFALRLLLVSSMFSMDIRLMFWSVAVSNAVLLPIMWARAGLRSPMGLVPVLVSAQTRRTVGAMMAFGFPMTLWYLSNILLEFGDRYVINFLLGPDAVGIYDANYRLIAGLAALLVVPVTITLHPYLMRIAGSAASERTGHVIGNVIENLCVVGALATGLIALLHADIAGVLLGRDFREGSLVMAPVLAGVFLGTLGTFAHKPFEILGRTRPMVVCGFSAAAVNIAACFLLVPPMGYVGAAYATVLAYLFYAMATAFLGRRLITWRIDLRKVSSHAGAALAGAALISIARAAALSSLPYAWDLAATVAACIALTGIVLLRLWQVRPGDTTQPTPERRRED